jgi:serine phosphatase RsbU (regulator of sigma subunit)/anti-sigma regulatory factor (Ser/Thr protein kinase)
MSESSGRSWRGSALRLSLACDLAEVLPAIRAVRGFLAEQGLGEKELTACELALAEACNNAINYARDGARAIPVEVEAICNTTGIELRVNDHTPGFEWPKRVELPEVESERGRGLFLIQSLMDSSEYFRGGHENLLRLRKNRLPGADGHAAALLSPEEVSRKLTESDQIINDMAEELSSCYESLSAIFRYSAEQGRSISLQDFSRRLLSDLLRITAADWFILRLVPKEQARLVVFTGSEPGLDLEPVDLSDPARTIDSAEVRSGTNRVDIWFDHQKPLAATDPLTRAKPDSLGLVHPFYFGDTLIGTLTLGKTISRTPFTAAQTNVVHTFADFLAIQIVNARFQEEQVNSLLVARDLQIAKNIQRSLLLKTLPQLPGFGLAGYCESARQVGGDFYDVIKLSDNSLLLIIADVMGKGIPAAMFAAILRSLLRALPELTSQPSALLSRVNRLLFDELSDVDMFITAQLVYVDVRERRLITASAGHCPLLLAVANDSLVKTLSPEGMPLGILPDTTFTDESASLANNCRVLLYTDGLTEARNGQGDLFGQERLIEWLRHSALSQRTAEELKENLVAELTRFQANASLKDDQTFLIMAE